MRGSIRLAVVAAIVAAGVAAISTGASAQRYYRGNQNGLVTSNVYLPYGGGYYGSGSTGRYSGPFRTDSAPGGGGGY